MVRNMTLLPLISQGWQKNIYASFPSNRYHPLQYVVYKKLETIPRLAASCFSFLTNTALFLGKGLHHIANKERPYTISQACARLNLLSIDLESAAGAIAALFHLGIANELICDARMRYEKQINITGQPPQWASCLSQAITYRVLVITTIAYHALNAIAGSLLLGKELAKSLVHPSHQIYSWSKHIGLDLQAITLLTLQGFYKPIQALTSIQKIQTTQKTLSTF